MDKWDLRHLIGYTLDDFISFHDTEGLEKMSTKLKNVKGGRHQKIYNTRVASQLGGIRAFRTAVRGHNATFPRMMSSSEKKNIDSAPTIPAAATPTGVLTLLNGCIAGALPTNRVGRRITMTSFTLKANFRLASTSTGTCPVRVLIFYDKQSNKLAPGITDVLAANRVDALMNLSNSNRFSIVADEFIPCLGTGGPQSAYMSFYRKLGLPAEYIDGTGSGDITDITSGSLYALIFANNSIATTAITGDISARVRYSDL